MAAASAEDDGLELPLPAASVEEESLFDVTADTLDARLCFLGLDNAGKTTLLQMLKNDRMVAQVPTLHPQCEEILIDQIRFKAFDLAGHETARRVWKDYFISTGAIIFMVDASDRTRFPEAAEELKHLMDVPALVAVPMAVLGTKSDKKDAASDVEFREAMGLSGQSIPADRLVEVFMVSMVQKVGYGDAIRWMSKILLDRRVVLPAGPAATAGAGASSADAGGVGACPGGGDEEEDFMV